MSDTNTAPDNGPAVNAGQQSPAGRSRTATPDELRALADQIESRECTGMVASWCPLHGDCRGCTRREDGEWDEFAPSCPLHGEPTNHAAAETAYASAHLAADGLPDSPRADLRP